MFSTLIRGYGPILPLWKGRGDVFLHLIRFTSSELALSLSKGLSKDSWLILSLHGAEGLRPKRRGNLSCSKTEQAGRVPP